MNEVKHLDEVRMKKVARFKEDGDKQIQKYKQMIELLKNQKKTLKDDIQS